MDTPRFGNPLAPTYIVQNKNPELSKNDLTPPSGQKLFLSIMIFSTFLNFLTPDWFQMVINDDKRLQTTIVLHSLCTITHIFEAMQKNNFEKFSKFRISRHFHPY